MRYNDVIYLIDEKTVRDELGIAKKVKTERQVFANKFQVSTSEFYSDNLRSDSSTHAIRKKSSFTIRSESYRGEERYRYKDEEFEILRVADKGELIQLVGGVKIGKN